MLKKLSKKAEEEKRQREEKEKEIKRQWDILIEKLATDSFTISKKIKVFLDKCILIDAENKKWLFLTAPNDEYTISDYSDIISYSIKKNYVVSDNIEKISNISLKIVVSNGNNVNTFIRSSSNDEGKFMHYLEIIEEIKEWLEPIVNNEVYTKKDIKDFDDIRVYDDNSNTHIIINGLIGYEIIDSNTSATSAVSRAAIGAAVVGPVGLAAGMSAKKKYYVILYFGDRTKNVKLGNSDFQILLDYVAENNIPRLSI